MSRRLREIGLGLRLALSGGRASWSRTAMTAVGVGLGVALLLLAAAAPTALDGRDARAAARDFTAATASVPHAGDRTLLLAPVDTTFRDDEVRGILLRPEGARAPVPPGVARIPRVGEVVVSPRLRDLLASPDGQLLRPRVPGRIIGTIDDAGLRGPQELAYYAGAERLTAADGVWRIDRFGSDFRREPLSPILALLMVVALVVLLVPVAVFLSTAVRFGGEARDRRLSALSLVGADRSMVRRIAAGEALLGASLGLVVGGAVYALAVRLVERLSIGDLSVFAADLRPSAVIAAAIVVAVPVLAVAVTLLSMGRVAVDPLGVVRRGSARRRRVAWRLALPVVGLLVLAPLARVDVGAGESVNAVQVSIGVTLLLVGVTALLPWVVEAVVHRLGGGGGGGGGGVPWQLAVRRLQADSGSAARVVSGIAVAVAGAIALATFFGVVEDRSSRATGAAVGTYQAQLLLTGSAAERDPAAVERALSAVPGVRPLLVRETADVTTRRGDGTAVTIAGCATLRRLARVRGCTDGDTFVVRPSDARAAHAPVLRPGTLVRNGEARWRVPRDARTVAARPGPDGAPIVGAFATPSAVAAGDLPGRFVRTEVALAEGRDVVERLRNAAAALDPMAYVATFRSVERDDQFVAVRRGIVAGAIAVLLLIGVSMLVGALEQLHERRRLLASLVAFGTPPATIRRSVLLQTAVPVALGLALAVGTGLALGAILLRLVDAPVRYDLVTVLGISAVGAAVVPLVTLLSAPALRRILRPGGLRTE